MMPTLSPSIPVCSRYACVLDSMPCSDFVEQLENPDLNAQSSGLRKRHRSPVFRGGKFEHIPMSSNLGNSRTPNSQLKRRVR
jgi:hypothetical protein